MEYLLKKKKAIMSVANQNFGFLKTVSGEPPVLIENTLSANLSNYQIHGNLRQDGTPSPSAPVAIESVGEYNASTGKYEIAFGSRRERVVVHLNQPLKKLGDYSDYIDFKKNRVVRRIDCVNILSGNVYLASIGKTNPCFYSSWASGVQSRLVGTPILLTHDTQIMSAGALSGNGLHVWAHNLQVNAPYIYWGLSYSFLSNYLGIELGKTSTEAELKAAFKAFCEAEAEKGTPIMLYWVARYESYETLSLPRISVNAGTDTFSVNTFVKPSKVTVEYFSKTL